MLPRLHRIVVSTLWTLALAALPAGPAEASTPPPAALKQRLLVTFDFPVGNFGDQLGTVAGLGDVNGDGYPDWAAGAPGSNEGGGRVYLFWGGPGADIQPDVTFNGNLQYPMASAFAGAGDFNGDGYADLILGRSGGSFSALQGQAEIHYGSSSMNTFPDVLLSGDQPDDDFGFSVAGAGDVNGDGFDDVIVGARWSDGVLENSGRAFVYYGGGTADAQFDLVLNGEGVPDFFGHTVSGAGDVNADGFADVLVGAHGNDAGGSGAGRAYLFLGGAPANEVADVVFTGAAPGARLGESVSSVGDWNGDGFDDVILGGSNSPNPGRAYVYHGGSPMNNVADLTLNGSNTFESFGLVVSGAGDVNGDGFGDAIVSAHLSSAAELNGGRAYLYYGGATANAIADHMLNGVRFSGFLGRYVAGIGDVFGDGCDDVIVGAPNETLIPGVTQGGAAYVYDLSRYFLTAPNGGETWNVGSLKALSWSGAEPANIWLSIDGGHSYQLHKQNVGGEAFNTYSMRVPHTPTKFARIKITPANSSVSGEDASDSLFTIQTSVALLSLLAAPSPQGGASVSWQSDPGPEDLAGYRLEASAHQVGAWRTVAPLTRETSVTDPEGGPGTRYRLFAVNGFGEELWLGETATRPRNALSAWPLPYRGGTLNVSFASAGGLGGGGARTELAVHDLHGRLVKRLAKGTYSQGHHGTVWDGRDENGREVASGVYFLRSASGGDRNVLRLCVLR